MLDMQLGQVVFSKAGHDKGRAFVIISADNGFAMISDGETRLIEKPKKKKLKHLQPVNNVIDISGLHDFELKGFLKIYNNIRK